MARLPSLRPRPRARAWSTVALALAAGLAAASRAGAADAALDSFFGSYVGVAEVHDASADEVQKRDMDIVIEAYEDEGFKLHWVNVSLVKGRRDLPGVERRVQTALFEPADDRDFYVEVEEGNPFRERQQLQPMQGDPVRWAAIAGPRMHVYSFVVLEDGQYELQIYDRVLTDKGLDIDFQRIVDGQVTRRITGHTVRTAGSASPAE